MPEVPIFMNVKKSDIHAKTTFLGLCDVFEVLKFIFI